MALRRNLLLAARFSWASKARVVLLVAIVAVGMVVFVVVTTLAAVSTSDLDQAISSASGATGTYQIRLDTSLGNSVPDAQHLVDDGSALFRPVSRTWMETFAPISLACPDTSGSTGTSATIAGAGSREVTLIIGEDKQAMQAPYGQNSGIPICISGVQIQSADYFAPRDDQQSLWGSGVVLRSQYRDLVESGSLSPARLSVVLVTGRNTDETDAINRSVVAGLNRAGMLYGVPALDTVAVRRIDSNAAIRTASASVKVVYNVIGWGVLGLGGLGVLVTELIVVRDRMWFFGLSRAVGARRVDVVALVVADIVVVLMLGSLSALAILAALGPAASAFAADTFQVHMQLLDASVLPRLFAGQVVVLLVAGLMPALRASRQDPVVVLEPKTN
ncbi:MAG: transporter permease [Frankiales bacterium]|nr:transporter permease [Frankiales bacterium]